MLKLSNWVPEDKLTTYLSINPRAGKYLEEHPEFIDWMEISSNPGAIQILEKNPEDVIYPATLLLFTF
jgi:hypothetical protein